MKKLRHHRILLAASNPDVAELLIELSHLMDAADPTPSTSGDGPKPAETPLPVDARRWARLALEQALEDLRDETWWIQAKLQVPPEERTTVTRDHRCVACGRRFPTGVRSSTGEADGHRPTEAQMRRLQDLATDQFGSLAAMETRLGVTVSDLTRRSAKRLIRSLTRTHPSGKDTDDE